MPVLIRFLLPCLIVLECLGCAGVKADPDSRDADERRLGALNLGSRSDAATLRKLLTLLDDSDDLVREAALRSIGRIGLKESAQHVKPKLRDPSPIVRTTAVEVELMLEGRDGLVVVLPLLLQDPDPSVRVSVIEKADAYVMDSMMVEVLMNAVDDKDIRVSVAAHDTLSRISGQDQVQRSKKSWEEWADKNPRFKNPNPK